MRSIFINGRFLSQPITWTQRYGHELLRSLDSLLAESEPDVPPITVLIPSSVRTVPPYRHLQVAQVGNYSGQIWEQFELPHYAKGGLLFTPCGGAPLLHRRNIITIHDAAVIAAPLGYSRIFRTWYQFLNRWLCRSALHILTVSNFSKEELIKWYGAKAERITVSYLGSEHVLRTEPERDFLEKHQLRRFEYVLSVGSRNPNKNLRGLVDTIPYLVKSKIQVAIAGLNDPKVFGKLRIADNLVCDLGYVNDSELRTLYENAACFVFPSFYEGFGLPPLEALALGCPIVVANSSALSEIFKDNALMCNPNDPSDIADKILQICNNTPVNGRVSNQTFASRFQWDDCAKITWKVVERFAKAN